jgi:hypothetical protein
MASEKVMNFLFGHPVRLGVLTADVPKIFVELEQLRSFWITRNSHLRDTTQLLSLD